MKKEIEVTGKTVEEAKEKAAKEFGVSADKIDIVVLDEPKKGLFGIGSTPARICATYEGSGADKAVEFVKNLLDNLGVEAEINVSDTEIGGKKIDIKGEGASLLIGHHGDTLDAFQYLVNLSANREGKDDKALKISVDVEGYRAKREETLRSLARRMADKVLKFKKSVMLEPMNPYERRIIHSEVQQIKGVSTNSIGSENNRKVVIFLDDTKEN